MFETPLMPPSPIQQQLPCDLVALMLTDGQILTASVRDASVLVMEGNPGAAQSIGLKQSFVLFQHV